MSNADTSKEALERILDDLRTPIRVQEYEKPNHVLRRANISRLDAAKSIAALLAERDAVVVARDSLGNMWAGAVAERDRLAAEVEWLRAERDAFETALGRACLVGGTTYLVERAEKAEAEIARLTAALALITAQEGK